MPQNTNHLAESPLSVTAFSELNLEENATPVDDGQREYVPVAPAAGTTRKEVEVGLQALNSIPGVLETIVAVIEHATAIKTHRKSLALYCNSALALLSDFTPHYKMLISANLMNQTTEIEAIVTGVQRALESLIEQPPFQGGAGFQLAVQNARFFSNGDSFTPAICVILRIGAVYHVPVFTAFVLDNVFKNEALLGEYNGESLGEKAMKSELLQPIESQPFAHNGKTIQSYNRVDLLLELLLHSQESNVYAPVNAIVVRGVNALIVSKFEPSLTNLNPDPDGIIQRERNVFLDVLFSQHEAQLCPAITKSLLISIAQNPSVRTSDGQQFSDIFSSGLYSEYFNAVAYQPPTKSEDQVPIVLKVDNGSTVPLTRLDIIVAALTAFNDAIGPSAHIVVAGGAAVSHYVANFVKEMRLNSAELDALFGEVVASGAPGETLKGLEARCDGVAAMNDIDCFVFGNVSRRLLSVFSLYMMLLYDKFFAHPKRCDSRQSKGVRKFVFKPTSASESGIELYMYGNQDDDVNTQLISKRLKKNPEVQIVSQETKHFLQLVHPLCIGRDETNTLCKEDDCYMQPIDLVKKSTEHFVDLYLRSLYIPDCVAHPKGLETLIQNQFFEDNMVSLKSTMLDLICILCDEGRSLFVRIFMARKNKKDFDRLRVFMDIYLLQLLRSDPHFAEFNADFIEDVRDLRILMNNFEKHYLERGNIAAVDAATAAKVDAERDAFLALLRKVGRKIVELPGPSPSLEPIPLQFQAASGRTTIDFFKTEYRFEMDHHASELLNLYERKASHEDSAELHEDEDSAELHEEWLRGVLFALDQGSGSQNSAAFFSKMLREILDKNTDDATQDNSEIGLKNMPVILPSMLQMLHAHAPAHAATETPQQFTEAATETPNQCHVEFTDACCA